MNTMNKSFQLSVNKQHKFDVSESDLKKLDAVAVGDSKFHILKNNQPFQAEIVASDFNRKKYTVRVNNTNYSVEIANDLDQLITKMGFEVGSVKHINAIKAPMPGLILEINVVVGQTVQENDNLIILGAMKMENSFHSPRNGVIKSIAVAVGDAVEKGQLLIEFE